MNRKETLALCLVALTLVFSITSVLYPANSFPKIAAVQDAENTQHLAMSAPLVLGVAFQNRSTLLSQPTRHEIYTFIKENPGVHFRGITNSLSLSVGVVQYHLDVLVHAGLLTVYSDGQNKRYFAANDFKEADAKLVMLLRHQTTRNILSLLSSEGALTHKDVSESLGLSSQALSWQMNQLRKTGLVEATKEGVNVRYVLREQSAAKIDLLLHLCDGHEC